MDNVVINGVTNSRAAIVFQSSLVAIKIRRSNVNISLNNCQLFTISAYNKIIYDEDED